MDSAKVIADTEPADVFRIDTFEKLRVISNPLRMQILDCLIPQAHTVKEVGDLLDLQSNTRYYHISELERTGMIRVVDTVITSGIQQKYYRATGRYYRLEPALLHSDDQPGSLAPAAAFLSGALEVSAGRLRKSVSEGLMDRDPYLTKVTRRTIKANREHIAEIRKRLDDLEMEFASLHQDDAPDEFDISLALFPTIRSDRPDRK